MKLGGTDSLGHIIYGDGFGPKMEPRRTPLEVLLGSDTTFSNFSYCTVIEIAAKHLLQLLDRSMLMSPCETMFTTKHLLNPSSRPDIKMHPCRLVTGNCFNYF